MADRDGYEAVLGAEALEALRREAAEHKWTEDEYGRMLKMTASKERGLEDGQRR